MTRPLSRRQKYRIYNVTIEQAEARWQCQTCYQVTEHDAAIYCRHCRMYWEDVRNGLFDFDELDAREQHDGWADGVQGPSETLNPLHVDPASALSPAQLGGARE